MDHPAPLTDLLIHKGAAVQTAVEAALGNDCLTLLRVGLLHALCEGPQPLSELADHLCCGKSNVTKQVDRLEAEGWVRRTPSQQDRRVILAEITDDGRKVRDHAAGQLRQWEAALHDRLGAKKAKDLLRLLAQI